MRKHFLIVAAMLVALLPLTACANTRSESSAPAQPPGRRSGRQEVPPRFRRPDRLDRRHCDGLPKR